MPAAAGVHVSAVASGTSVTSASRTSTGAGSIFTVLAESDITPNTPTDSKSNVYTAVTTATVAGGITSRLYDIVNGVGGASHTWSFGTGSSADLTIYAQESTGCLTVAARDQFNQGVDAATPFGNAVAITTTQADEIIIAAMHGNSATTPATHAESTGFTIQETVTTGGPNWTGCLATKVVAATGTYNASFTESGATTSGCHIVSYKASGGGGGGATVKQLSALGVG